MATIRRKLPRQGDDDIRLAAQLPGVRRLQLPGRAAWACTQIGELITKPAPRIGRKLPVPGTRARLVARKLRMVVRRTVAPRRIRQPIKHVGPPQRAVRRDGLGCRLAAAVRLRSQLAQLNPRAVLHGSIAEIDLEPMPHDDSTAGESQDVLHAASGILTPDLSPRSPVRAACSFFHPAPSSGSAGISCPTAPVCPCAAAPIRDHVPSGTRPCDQGLAGGSSATLPSPSSPCTRTAGNCSPSGAGGRPGTRCLLAVAG